MSSNIEGKAFLFAAICFIIAGIVGKDVVFIVLGCSFICLSYSTKKKTIDKNKSKS